MTLIRDMMSDTCIAPQTSVPGHGESRGLLYAGSVQYLCNATPYVGLLDNMSDFRLSTRTIILNPLLRFLYWHMNYHTEHHTYAAVPCYRLGTMHKLIRHDLPPSPRGLLAAWSQIVQIGRRRKEDPAYQFRAALPAPAMTERTA